MSNGGSSIDSKDQREPLIPKYQASGFRWMVLVLTSGTFAWQAFLLIQLIAIARSLQQLFGWDRTLFSLISMYWCILTVIFAAPAAYVLQWLGIRKCTIFLNIPLFLSCLARCFATTRLTTTILTHISALLYSIPAVFQTALPVQVSSLWFPPKERMLSTSIGVVMNEFGAVIASLVAPLVVQSPGPNATSAIMLDEYYHYTWVTTALTGLFTIVTLILVPKAPKRPVSASSDTVRLRVTAGYSVLLKSKVFWSLSAVFSLSFSSYVVLWILLNILMEDMDVTQVEAGAIGVVNSIVAIISGTVLSAISGIYQSPKATVVSLHLVGLVGTVWLLLTFYSLVPRNVLSTGTAVAIFCGSSTPVFGISQEMACDALYPVPELAISAAMLLIACAASAVIFAISTIESISMAWFYWLLLAGRVISFFLFTTVPYETRRSNADSEKDATQANQMPA